MAWASPFKSVYSHLSVSDDLHQVCYLALYRVLVVIMLVTCSHAVLDDVALPEREVVTHYKSDWLNVMDCVMRWAINYVRHGLVPIV